MSTDQNSESGGAVVQNNDGSMINRSAAARPQIGGPVWCGLAILGVFTGVMMLWSSLAPLTSAAIALGAVKVEYNRKTVQHLEGGIIHKILVKDGDRVQVGDVLIELDETKVKARMDLLEGQFEAENTQLSLIGEEIDAVESLLKLGLAQKPRLLALQRRLAELIGNRKRVESQIIEAKDTLERSKIRAISNGTIVGLKVHTVGGVVAAGTPLMDIVPNDQRLIIEAAVDPNDIDVVRPDLDALVYLTPYSRRSLVPIKAQVMSVSADQMTNERTGAAFFSVLVKLLEDPELAIKGAKLYPGMPVEVMIVTGERTLLDMLFEPLFKSYRRAFKGE